MRVAWLHSHNLPTRVCVLLSTIMLAVISGGSQGIGLAIGEIYRSQGWEVVLVARTESKLEVASRKVGASYIAADVSVPSECARVFKELGEVPDLVFCCAGAAQPGMFLEMAPEDLAKNLRTVYDTALYFSQAALKVMAAAADKHTVRRHLVYCSSTVAVFPFIGYSAYAPAKAAIRSLSDIVRQECMEHNIRVSHILPGSADTEGYAVEELTKPAITKTIEGASKPLPPADVARIVVSQLQNGNDTIYSDTISWVLGSMMMGISPRAGTGFLQTLVGVFLVIFGPVVRWFIHKDIRGASEESRKLR